MLAPGPGREAARAHFHLLQLPEAGAWLHAPPSEALGLHVVSRLFRVTVQLRLRLPVMPADIACPLCDGVADRFGDHSRCCPCGGDRVKRHNHLRSIVAGRAQSAGLSSKSRSLAFCPFDRMRMGLTPAGVGQAGEGRLMSGLCNGPCMGQLPSTSQSPPGCDQERCCWSPPALGLQQLRPTRPANAPTFKPSSSVWPAIFPPNCRGLQRRVGPHRSRHLARPWGAHSCQDRGHPGAETDRLLQSLAIALQRENARAVLRRLPSGLEDHAVLAEP